MERRRALVVAGTMTATLAMAGTAMAVNMGLLGSDSDSVGNLTATEIQPTAQRETRPTAAQRTPRVRVVVQDIPVRGRWRHRRRWQLHRNGRVRRRRLHTGSDCRPGAEPDRALRRR